MVGQQWFYLSASHYLSKSSQAFFNWPSYNMKNNEREIIFNTPLLYWNNPSACWIGSSVCPYLPSASPPPAFSPPIYPSTHSFNQPLIHLTHHPINHPPPSIHWSIYPTIHLTLNQPSIHLFTHTPNHPPTRAPTFLYIAPLRARCNAKVSSLSVWSIHSDTFSASFSKSYNQVYLCAILMLNVILLEVWK